MIVLAIDTATDCCAACLYDAENSQLLSEQTLDIGRGHAEHLLSTIDNVFATAKLSFDEIDKIAVSIGPGSFTGIRVGVATARGLGLALDKPTVGVSTLEAVAVDFASKSPFAVAIQAGRGQAYIQRFDAGGGPQDKPFIVKLDNNPGSQIEQIYSTLIGNAAELIDEARATALLDRATGSIENIALLGATSNTQPNPLYIRQADAKIAQGFALPRQSEVAK